MGSWCARYICFLWKFGSAGSTRVACPTSVPERLELYGEVRPKRPTLRRRAPKNTKNRSGGWGKAFWPESRPLTSISKSILPPPPFGGYHKIEKCTVLTHFRTIFNFSKVTKCCKLQHFCVLTSFAGAMQKRRKCCKYQYVFNQRCTKHCKYQCFSKPSKKTL